MRVTLLLTALLLFGACEGDHRSSETAPGVDVEREGEPIPVNSDPAGASYQLVRWSELPNGHREALTRRDGSSGTSYARREIDCAGREFRYIGEGDTRQEAEAEGQNPGEMAELTAGSISSEVADFVCAK